MQGTKKMELLRKLPHALHKRCGFDGRVRLCLQVIQSSAKCHRLERASEQASERKIGRTNDKRTNKRANERAIERTKRKRKKEKKSLRLLANLTTLFTRSNGYYLKDGECKTCGNYGTSAAGSTSSSDCVCDVGYFNSVDADLSDEAQCLAADQRGNRVWDPLAGGCLATCSHKSNGRWGGSGPCGPGSGSDGCCQSYNEYVYTSGRKACVCKIGGGGPCSSSCGDHGTTAGAGAVSSSECVCDKNYFAGEGGCVR